MCYKRMARLAHDTTRTMWRGLPEAMCLTLLVLFGVLSLVACKELTGDQQLPAGTVNPATYNTSVGALGMRTQAIYALEQALLAYLIDTGLLTDELRSYTSYEQGFVGNTYTQLPMGGLLDARILPALSYGDGRGPADQDYMALQKVRAEINQALGALAAYDMSATAPVLRGELYALEGYTEILLADFFCSGIPLSTLDFQQDYTYHSGSTTMQVYQDALTKLDSARALTDTSTRVQNLVRVLQGRAWLALGQYDSASVAVTVVPDSFQYKLALNFVNSGNVTLNILNDRVVPSTVSDSEGSTGLPYVSSNDPRTHVINWRKIMTYNGDSVQLTFPARYNALDVSPFTVADGIEARLIRAEATLHSDNPAMMVSILNQLRTTATVPGQTALLPDTLTDPGTDSARVTLLFRERAFWLFLTGHRQGDLRRLLRQYRQWFHQSNQVYPTGPFTAAGATTYGTDVTAPIPGNEYINPLFRGCIDRDP